MSTKSQLVSLFVFVLVLVSALVAGSNPFETAKALNGQWQPVSPTCTGDNCQFSFYMLDAEPDDSRTGPVSKTCIHRNLFKYHNIDKAACGEPAADTARNDGQDTNANDDGGNGGDDGNDDGGCTVNCGNDGGDDDGDDDGGNGGCTTNCDGGDDDKPVIKVKVNKGNHYGDGNGNSGKDQPDNNQKDVKNDHNGDDTRSDFEETKEEKKNNK